MKTFSLALAIFTFLLISCQDQNIVEQIDENGKIQLSFDKSAIPEDVVLITALLTRDGFDPVSGSMNILSPNSAEITLENLAAGVWYLKVEALDANNMILYTGETDVEIISNTITPVALTLMPNGNLTGSVLITVTWGVPPTNWEDYQNNPILTKQFSPFDEYGVGFPHVLKEDGIYKMWYQAMGPSNGLSYVYYATSPDGISWNVHPIPVLMPGNSMSWDSGRAGVGPIIKEDGYYKMYYNSFKNSFTDWKVGIATSADGILWEKNPDPVFEGRPNEWDEKVTANHIEIINNTYYMYYTGYHFGWDYQIGLATSSDGVNWVRYQDDPIMTLSQNWEDDGVGMPTIIYDDGIYKMIYHETTPLNNGFGLATSTDGINWTKSNSNPVFTNQNTSQNWIKIGYPFLFQTENTLRMYYTGFNENLIMNINFADYQE